ncbi:MAG: class I SAM-dependent methyltransferase [Candidatus Glassbacteria bacterium]|nr:class I SAM-dependent methyltransferase [Candidatus Glassbacteria bacterium]
MTREETIPDNELTAKELRQRLKEQIQQVGECLEREVLPLAGDGPAGTGGEFENSGFMRQCKDHADRVFELLDLTRDLSEARLLVLDNGTGHLPRRLADWDTDVVAVELTEKLKKSATLLNSYPSIIYRKTNPFILSQEFDLVLDSGILSYFHPEIVKYFLPRLARFSRRKMILGFRTARPWRLRLLTGIFHRENDCTHLDEFRFSPVEVDELIETSCNMLLTERNVSGTSLLIKALRKPHSVGSGRSDPG